MARVRLRSNRDKEYGDWYRGTEHGKETIRRLRKEQTPEIKMLYRARSRSKSLGVDFNIDISDIVIPINCPITGLELSIYSGNKGFRDHSPSLDRIDPNKGYVKGNVRVISMKANKCKSNLSLEEIENLYKYSKGLI